MFASPTIIQHLARGMLGFTALSYAMRWLYSGASFGIVGCAMALTFALLMLRGCPTCWTIGLVQTLYARIAGKSRAERLLGEKTVCEGNCPLQ